MAEPENQQPQQHTQDGQRHGQQQTQQDPKIAGGAGSGELGPGGAGPALIWSDAASPRDAYELGRHGRQSGTAGVRLKIAAICHVWEMLITIPPRKTTTTLRDWLGPKVGRTLATPQCAQALMLADHPVTLVEVSHDRWLAVSDAAHAADGALQQALLSALPNSPIAISDQHDSRVGISLAGPMARSALAKGCGVDLDESTFGMGRATATAFGHIPVVLWRADNETDTTATFAMLVPRSYATALIDDVIAAASEYGVDII